MLVAILSPLVAAKPHAVDVQNQLAVANQLAVVILATAANQFVVCSRSCSTNTRAAVTRVANQLVAANQLVVAKHQLAAAATSLNRHTADFK